MPKYLFILLFVSGLFHAHAGASLQDLYQWQQRLLLVNANSVAEKLFVMKKLEVLSEQLQERKLTVLIKSGEHLSSMGQPPKQENEIKDAMNQTFEEMNGDILLIGLDGGVKFVTDIDSFDMNSIFALIDRMPMRRAELTRNMVDK